MSTRPARCRSRFVTQFTMSLLIHGATVPAMADCTAIRGGTADFDQRREAAPGIPGLAGGGRSHCFPSTWTSWFAYLNQHGYPTAMATAEVVDDWSDPARYNQVTDVIGTLGVFCSTDPDGGTGDPDGLLDYLVAQGLGDAFSISVTKIDWTDATQVYNGWVAPGHVALHIRNGGLVGLGIAWSEYEGGVNVVDGGHVVGAPAMLGACDDVLLLYRDPATGGDDRTTQSTFDYEESTFTPVTELFQRGTGPTSTRTVWQMDRYGDREAFLSGLRILYPNVAGVLPPAATSVGIVRPWRLDGDKRPELVQMPLPGGFTATDLALHPSGLGAVIAARRVLPTLQRRVYWYDFAGETLQLLVGLDTESGALAIDRRGHLWVVRTGGALQRIRLELQEGGVAWSVRSEHDTALAPAAFAYADAIDRVFVLSTVPGNGSPYLELIDPDAGSVGGGTLVGTDLVPPYHVASALDASEIWIGCATSSTIRRYGADPDTGAPSLRAANTLSALGAIQSVQETDRGRLLLTAGGTVHEYTWSPLFEAWLATNASGLDGRTDVAQLRVSRSRADEHRYLDPASDPANLYVLPEDDHAPCDADLDHDGAVGLADLLIVLSTWGPCDLACAGDANADHAVDFADLVSLLSAWGPCP